ncbi:hypothetical protein [Chryseobacterium sp. 2VB]|uniref:hypothetical protein n=1 Tax=Chryseobacterium sp. 2VB TaxID=2502204 RepID=UPI0010F677CA|nr:hypothetical protein [Chryseobacterium sp. 2VB]
MHKPESPDYKRIYEDLVRLKYPAKKQECESILSKPIFSVKDVITINNILFPKANIYNRNSDMKRSFYYTDKVEKENLINSDTDFEVLFYLHLQRSLLYQKLGERVASLKQLDEIYDRVIQTNNAYFIYLINWQYAGIYNEINKKKLALKHYKTAYKYSKIYRENKNNLYRIDKNRLSNSYKTSPYLGGMYLELNKPDSAKIYIEEAIQNEKK